MASGAELQKMDEATAELRRVMAPAVAWAAEQEDSLFGEYTRTEAEDALLKNITDEKARTQEWLTTWRAWAERGLNASGAPYPVSFYLRVGKDLASAFASYSKLQAQAGAFILGQTVAQSASDLATGAVRAGTAAQNVLKGVEDAATALGKPWPTWVKLLLGAAGVGLLAMVGVRLADKAPDLNKLTGGSGEGGP